MSEQKPKYEAESIFCAKKNWHVKQANLPLREKVRILLELQRQDFLLLQRHRTMHLWERPWDIVP
ncbi:MAG: hypothetical protein JW841_10165 [Deltaproteobacteria bacterium]|nr:hypothetical protein [Deltaproteobacteria bacterium]